MANDIQFWTGRPKHIFDFFHGFQSFSGFDAQTTAFTLVFLAFRRPHETPNHLKSRETGAIDQDLTNEPNCECCGCRRVSWCWLGFSPPSTWCFEAHDTFGCCLGASQTFKQVAIVAGCTCVDLQYRQLCWWIFMTCPGVFAAACPRQLLGVFFWFRCTAQIFTRHSTNMLDCWHSFSQCSMCS